MSEIKVNLSIVLPGRIMLSTQDCVKKSIKRTFVRKGKRKFYKDVYVEEEDTSKMIPHHMVLWEDRNKPKEHLFFYTRDSIPAKQSINISKEAYEYMVDKDSCPEWERLGTWVKKSRVARLESHLQRICESKGGLSYTYQIFED